MVASHPRLLEYCSGGSVELLTARHPPIVMQNRSVDNKPLRQKLRNNICAYNNSSAMGCAKGA